MKKLFSLLTLLLLLCSRGVWAYEGISGDVSLTSISNPGAGNKFQKIQDGIYMWRGASSWSYSSSYGIKTQSCVGGVVFYIDNTKDVTVDILHRDSKSSDVTAKVYTLTEDNYKVFYNGTNNSTVFSDLPSTETYSFTISLTTTNGETRSNNKVLSSGYYAIVCTGEASNIYFNAIHFAASGPTINTQPVGAAYATGQEIAALTVDATASDGGDLSYQWYSCDDAEKANAEEIDGATSASYTPTGAGFYYVDVTDGNGTTTSDVVEITVSAASAPESISVTANATSVYKNADVTLTASVTGGVPTPTIHWYSCTNAEKAGASEIVAAQGEETYSPSTAALGTYYFYATASNGSGTVSSSVVTITINGHTDCELTNIKFSNGAYGAIGTLSDGAATITVPYLSGEPAPSINESSIVISATATKSIDGNTIIVTAEDGTTTGTYTITKTAFTPLSVSGDIDVTAFGAVPSWAFNPYGYDASKGVKFAKDVNEASNMRISKGITRQYYFIEAAQTLTLTSGSGGNRGIKVYRNGVKLDTPTATGATDATIDIALNPSAPCMIVIESSGNSGDGGFTKYAVTANTNVTATIGATGWTTFSSNYALDLSEMTAAHTVAAYYAYDAEGTSVKVRTTTATVPVGEGLLLKGTAGDAVTIPVVASGTEIDGNLLKGCTTSTVLTANAAHYVLVNNGGTAEFQSLEDNGATIPAGKAYLNLSDVSLAPGALRIVEEENQATSIEALDATENAVKFIQDGKLFIKKNNVVYDMMGTAIR